MAIKLSYTITDSLVFPEILVILDEMIRLYNDWEASTYFKLEGCHTRPGTDPQSGTSSRYILFKTKEDLLASIMANCPTGCTLTDK